MPRYLGIDLGGTTCRVGAYDSLDDPKQTDIRIFEWDGAYKKDFPRMLEAIDELSQGGDLGGIGIGTAGSVDAARTRIEVSPNQPTWNGQPLVEPIRKRFGVSVGLANDAEAAALGEAAFGYGKGSDFWFVIWGTGIGAAFVRGSEVRQTEMGHAVMDPSGPECPGCRVRGCVESFAGGRALEARFGKPPKELDDNEWAQAEKAMGCFVYNLFRASESELVVIGGGVAGKQPKRLPTVEAEARKFFHEHTVPKVVGSKLGEQGGLIGALAVLQQFGKP